MNAHNAYIIYISRVACLKKKVLSHIKNEEKNSVKKARDDKEFEKKKYGRPFMMQRTFFVFCLLCAKVGNDAHFSFGLTVFSSAALLYFIIMIVFLSPFSNLARAL